MEVLCDVLETTNLGKIVFAMLFEQIEFGYRCICHVVGTSEIGAHVICDVFGTNEFGDHGICDGFGTREFKKPWYLLCIWKQRIRGPWFLRDGFGMDFKKSRLQRRKLLVSAAYYVCITKNRYSSHGTPGVPRRMIRLYYKNRFSTHGSSVCPRRIRLYYKQSTFQPRMPVCPRRVMFVFKIDFPAIRFLLTRPHEKNTQRVIFVSMSRSAKTPRF